MTQVGDNVSYIIEDGDILHIDVDLTKNHGYSASGKTITVASTRGSARVEGAQTKGVMINLNIYKYPDNKA